MTYALTSCSLMNYVCCTGQQLLTVCNERPSTSRSFTRRSANRWGGKQPSSKQCVYDVILWRVRVTIFDGEKAISLIWSEYGFVALGNQHAKRKAPYYTGGADKSLARPTSRCIFLWWEYFVWCYSCYIYIHIYIYIYIYIYSTNIPTITIINRIYENQNLLSL